MNNKKITMSFKISIAAIIAIYIAQTLQLQFSISAGIVAILSVATTKKETITTALNRLLAFIIALVIAYACFNLIGFNLEAFFIYLVLYIGVCNYLGFRDAMALNSVLISHFLTTMNMNIASVTNELGIFIIGAGLGVLVNLHLRKDVDYIERLKGELDKQIKFVLIRMSKRIIHKDVMSYDGSCFKEMDIALHQAKSVAKENAMNQLSNKNNKDQAYIRMREKQIHVLYNMYQRVKAIDELTISNQHLATILEKMASQYHQNNSGSQLLQELNQLQFELKQLALPTTRKEFEIRAQLFVLLSEIEDFILIKNKFSKEYLPTV